MTEDTKTFGKKRRPKETSSMSHFKGFTNKEKTWLWYFLVERKKKIHGTQKLCVRYDFCIYRDVFSIRVREITICSRRVLYIYYLPVISESVRVSCLRGTIVEQKIQWLLILIHLFSVHLLVRENLKFHLILHYHSVLLFYRWLCDL